jgi:hypothetical protein
MDLKSDSYWESHLKQSIAMEFLPKDNISTKDGVGEDLANAVGSFIKFIANPQVSETSEQSFTKKVANKQIWLKQVCFDSKTIELNSKIKFFEDIIDPNILMARASPSNLEGAAESSPEKTPMHSWNFFDLNFSRDDMICVVRDIFQDLGFFSLYQIRPEVFTMFSWEVAYYYSRHGNPFHNLKHAVNICHAGFYFLKRYPRFRKVLDPLHQFSFIISCLGHDLDHRGKTNAFEINTRSKLAVNSLEKSPLEHHHTAVLLKILGQEDSDLCSGLNRECFSTFKKEIIRNIMATDMQLHFGALSDFKTKVLENPGFSDQDSCKKVLNPDTESERGLVAGNFIHMADLSGSAHDFPTMLEWSRLVNQEFRAQVRSSYIVLARDHLGTPGYPAFQGLG